MSSLYTAFRDAIGDSVSSYTISDSRLFRYLDSAIDKLSKCTEYRLREEVTVTSTDVTNGYFTLDSDIESIVEWETVPKYAYQILEDNKIRIVNDNYISAGTYTIEYNAYYKRFDGEDHEDSYFDYPKRAELGLLLYALGLYTQESTVVDKNGSGPAKRKREGDMEVEYVVDGSKYTASGAGDLKRQGLSVFNSLPNVKNFVFSIPMYR